MRRTGAWEEVSAWAKLQSAAVIRFQLQENLARCGEQREMWLRCPITLSAEFSVVVRREWDDIFKM